MSRIYEALRSAQEMRSKTGLTTGDGLGLMEGLERRESPRLGLAVELTVYGRSVDEQPFYEHAKAITENSSGGLFLLAVPVLEGQDLLLINNQTSEEQICRVVNVHIRDAQTSEVSVLFPSPNPEFWQIPAADGGI